MPLTSPTGSAWPPPLSKQTNKAKCQSIYWNLICSLEVRDGLGTLMINELRHTIRCDDVNNLSSLRNDIEKELGTKVLENIILFKTSEEDVARAESCIFHYCQWAKSEIYRGLTIQNKIYFNTLFQWDKWAAGFTIFGGGLGGLYKYTKRLASSRK